MIDLPDEQRRDLLDLDLGTGSALLLAGGPRSGRTGALVTAARLAASTLAPERLHVHVIDAAGGDAVTALAGLPHLGTAIRLEDCEHVAAALIAHLDELISGDRTGQDRAWAAQLLLIDGWVPVEQALSAHDPSGGLVRRAQNLLSRAHGSAISVIVTGDRALLSPRMTALVAERIVLPMTDPLDYAMVGLAPAQVPGRMPPGRGIRLRDGSELQLVIAPEPPAPTTITQNPADIAATGPVRFRPLPTTVPARVIGEAGRMYLGIGGDAGEDLWWDLSRGGVLLICGDPGPHRAGVLAAIAACARGAVELRDDLPTDPAEAALLTTRLTTPRPGHTLVLAVAPERVGAGFDELGRAIAAQRFGIVLQPGPQTLTAFGHRLGAGERGGPPGRGIAVPDPAWGWPGSRVTPGRIRVQLAVRAATRAGSS